MPDELGAIRRPAHQAVPLNCQSAQKITLGSVDSLKDDVEVSTRLKSVWNLLTEMSDPQFCTIPPNVCSCCPLCMCLLSITVWWITILLCKIPPYLLLRQRMHVILRMLYHVFLYSYNFLSLKFPLCCMHVYHWYWDHLQSLFLFVQNTLLMRKLNPFSSNAL